MHDPDAHPSHRWLLPESTTGCSHTLQPPYTTSQHPAAGHTGSPHTERKGCHLDHDNQNRYWEEDNITGGKQKACCTLGRLLGLGLGEAIGWWTAITKIRFVPGVTFFLFLWQLISCNWNSICSCSFDRKTHTRTILRKGLYAVRQW